MKPKSTYFIQGVINKEISEEEFFQKMSDSAGRMIIDLPEINRLKKHPSLLREFLLSLSIEGRFRIILTREMLGMQQTQFVNKYDIPRDTLRILKGQHEKVKSHHFNGEIREVVQKTRPPFELLATIAIMTRVPVQWLQQKKPLITQQWSVSHFEVVPHVYLTRHSFLQYLQETSEKAVENYSSIAHTRPKFPHAFDIRPIILKLDSEYIYLRASIQEQGDIIIELFGDKNQMNDYDMLKEILHPIYPLETGYCKTVIGKHVNMMILARHPSNELSYPIEFIKF